MNLSSQIAANLTAVTGRIAEAAASCGRTQSEVRLVAVSKTFGLQHVEGAVTAGLHDLGENKVQEAELKKTAATGRPIRWHFIGHLQSNKARKAVAIFDWIHSVDSVALLRRLDKAAVESGRTPQLLVQVDLAGEDTKHGASEAEVARIIDEAANCRSVVVRGLMVMPPWSENVEAARPYFRRLREMRDQLQAAEPGRQSLDQLSMGMSHDLEVAVEEGATMIRIGTALFGARERPEPL